MFLVSGGASRVECPWSYERRTNFDKSSVRIRPGFQVGGIGWIPSVEVPVSVSIQLETPLSAQLRPLKRMPVHGPSKLALYQIYPARVTFNGESSLSINLEASAKTQFERAFATAGQRISKAVQFTKIHALVRFPNLASNSGKKCRSSFWAQFETSHVDGFISTRDKRVLLFCSSAR